MNVQTATHSALAWFLVRQNTQADRATFKQVLEQHNLAHLMPRERHIADACRMALAEVQNIPPFEVGPGESARIITSPVQNAPKGEYAWDLHLQAQGQGQVDYPRLGQMRLKNGAVTAHLNEDLDLPMVIEMMLESVFVSLPAKAKFHQDTLDSNQLRSFLNDALEGHRFPIRPGVFFCLASSLPGLQQVDSILQASISQGEIRCSVYQLEPSSQNIQTLQVDLVGSIEEELDKIEATLLEAATQGKMGKAEAKANLEYLACLKANLDEFEGLLGMPVVNPDRLSDLENRLNSTQTSK